MLIYSSFKGKLMRYNLTENTEQNSSPEKIQDFLEAFGKNEELVMEFERRYEELTKQFSLQFDDIIKKFFEAVPVVKAITWTQYTPYFMDGDSCVFSVNEVNFSNFISKNLHNGIADYFDENDEDEDEDVIDDSSDKKEKWSTSLYYAEENKYLTAEQVELCKKVSKLISNDDMMESLFGDHTIIQISRDGMVQDDYEHD